MKGMNFKEQLVDSGKLIGELVAANVGNNPEHYKKILEMTLYEKMPMQSRAGRVLNICTKKYPYLFIPYIDLVLEHAKDGNVLHRSFLKLFAEVNVPLNREQEGLLLDICFTWLDIETLETAQVIFCFSILFKIVKKESDLAPELIAVIKRKMPNGTAGVKNRGGRILKALRHLS